MLIHGSLTDIDDSIRMVISIVYLFLALVVLTGNLLNFYSLCVSRDRYARKSLHLLIWNSVVEGTIWTSTSSLIHIVSYTRFNRDFLRKNLPWLLEHGCHLQTYFLRSMDFLLAYTIVCLCLDRCARKGIFCYGLRRFVTGLTISMCIWLIVCYALLPTFFVQFDIKALSYGTFECVYNESYINHQLPWLSFGQTQTPVRTIHLLDFIFGNGLPIVLMLSLLALRWYLYRRQAQTSFQPDQIKYLDGSNWNLHPSVDSRRSENEDPNLIAMVCCLRFILESVQHLAFPSIHFQVVLYVVTYVVCQLPYNVYRLIRIYYPQIESTLLPGNILFAIDYLLLVLRSINRAINPWLSFFFMPSIRESSWRAYSSFWCCGCFPFCPNRWSCLRECPSCFRHQWHILTSQQEMIREIQSTGNRMNKEFTDQNGKRRRYIYDEYIRYHHRPARARFVDINPALFVSQRNIPTANQLFPPLPMHRDCQPSPSTGLVTDLRVSTF